jgi:lysophospholipase L1-like esterase
LIGLAAEATVRLAGGLLGVDAAELAILRAYVCDGEVQHYAPRPNLVYALAPVPGEVNTDGFHDAEWRLERTPGVPRVACLGASTTEGGNPAGRAGAYPTFLEEELEASLGGDVEVMNCGISAWTTAESLAAWLLLLKDYRPDVVVVHHAANDIEPRHFGGFRADYAHYRRPWLVPRRNALHRALTRWSDAYAWYAARLDVPEIKDVVVDRDQAAWIWPNGTPPPETAAPFRRNLRSLGADAEAEGSGVVLATMPIDRDLEDADGADTRPWVRGIREHNAIVRALAAERSWTLADLEALAPELRGHFLDLVHLDPDGNRAKAQAVAEAILAAGLLARGQ